MFRIVAKLAAGFAGGWVFAWVVFIAWLVHEANRKVPDVRPTR
jgi:hypothetical protein